MIITTDQETGQLSNNLPLKILAKYNLDDKQKCAAFGTYFNARNLTGSLYQDDIIQIHTYTDLVKQDNILWYATNSQISHIQSSKRQWREIFY